MATTRALKLGLRIGILALLALPLAIHPRQEPTPAPRIAAAPASVEQTPEPLPRRAAPMHHMTLGGSPVRKDRLDEAPVIARKESPADAQGRVERVRIVQTPMKYPLLRIAETVRQDQVLEKVEMVADQVVVRLRPGTTEAMLQARVQALGLTVLKKLRGPNAFILQLPSSDPDAVPQALALLGKDAVDVGTAEPNVLIRLADTLPNDPSFGDQWALRNIGQAGGVAGADIKAAKAWDFSRGSASVKVAVIDTGIEMTHPDLAANIYTNPGEIPGNGIDDDGNGLIDDVHGWDFANADNDPTDDHYHGTHCAGIIGAAGNNGIGVSGICWNVRLVPIKFIHSWGGGYYTDAVESLYYATSLGVSVTSNSWTNGAGPLIQDAIKDADQHGVLFVGAAGNDATGNYAAAPARLGLPNMLCVAATTRTDALASFSNWSATDVHLGAPGEDVLSTFIGASYANLSGTSMATPYVAGACALLKSLSPQLSHDDIKSRILASVDAIPSLAGKCITGGRLNVFRALQSVVGAFPQVASIQVVDDGSQGTTGNGDGIAAPGEVVGLRITLRNIGTQAAVGGPSFLEGSDYHGFVTQGQANYPDVPANGQSVNSVLFLVALQPTLSTPDTFTLTLRVNPTGSTPWTFSVPLEILTPALLVGQARQPSGSPVAGARVRYSGFRSGEVVTNAIGEFQIPVVAGPYTLSARAPGFVSSGDLAVNAPSPYIGLILGQPVIEATLGGLNATVDAGASADRIISIVNRGDVPLTYALQAVSNSEVIFDSATDLWHITARDAYEGPTCWYFGLDGARNYDTGVPHEGVLTSKPFLMPPGLYSPSLAFYFRKVGDTRGRDKAYLEITKDGGATWLGAEWVDNYPDWTGMGVGLPDDFANQIVQIRFRFVTDGTDDDHEGYLVDSVTVQSTLPVDPDASWISVLPALSGTVSPSMGNLVTVRLNSAGLSTGTYTGRLRIGTNDFNQFRLEAPISLTVVPPSLPAGWSSADLGSGHAPGSASYSSGSFTISGSGQGPMVGASDQGTFVYQSLQGDGELIARVTSNGGGWPGKHAGVMIRESLADNAPGAVLDADGVGAQFRSRSGSTTSTVDAGTGTLPVWLRIVRRGAFLSGFRSVDGRVWTHVGSATVAMGNSVLIGLDVTGGQILLADPSSFDNVRLTPRGPAAALLVGATSPVGGADVNVRNQLVSLGYAVTERSGAGATAADADGKSIVLVSSTVTSTNVNTKFKTVPVPVINWESANHDDFGMTGTVSGTDFGTTTGQTSINIVLPTHPLAAGLTGTVPVVTAASTLSWGVPVAGAIKVATIAGNASRAVLFAFEPGAAMPARRVGFFLEDATASKLNPNGSALLARAIRWASSIPPAVRISSPVSGSTAGPAALAITAEAGDESGITKVEFLVDGLKIGEDLTAPYQATWTPVGTGSHLLTARATDVTGDVSTSSPVTVMVNAPALFVVGNATLTTADAAVRTRLMNLGYPVIVKAAPAATTADATGKSLVVISSTVASGDVNTKYRTVTVPVLCWEQAVLDDLGMTGVPDTQHGTKAAQTSINITNPVHPIAAGLSGLTPVVSPASTFCWGIPNSNAAVVATISGEPTKAVIFGYNPGVAMPGLAAPGRRVGFFLEDTGAAGLTASGGALFDAAVRWAITGGSGSTLSSIASVSSSLQSEIDAASPGDVVLLGEGRHLVPAGLALKPGISLRGAGPGRTILDGEGATAVLRVLGTSADGLSRVEQLTVMGGQTGIDTGSADVLLKNLAVVRNLGSGIVTGQQGSVEGVSLTVADNGGDGLRIDNPAARIRGAIVSGNGGHAVSAVAGVSVTYSSFGGAYGFRDPATLDYRESAGSPGVNAGDPADAVDAEPLPNGGRINQGAFGGTADATP